MAGTDNFQQWNPAQANQETDTQYAADTLRSGGATVDAILGSPVFNKFAYQVSTAVKALMDALANKGYTTSDAVLSTLTAQLQNIMTLADMGPYALLASPAFTGTPTAPTAPAGDNSAKVATTAFVAQSFLTAATAAATYATLAYLQANFAPLNSPHLSGIPTVPTASAADNSTQASNTSWVQGLLASDFSLSGNIRGAVKLGPSGLLFQWWFQSTPGSNYVAGTQFLVDYPEPFPSNSFAVFASNAYTPQGADFTQWNAIGGNQSQALLAASQGGLRSCFMLAIGM